ncbi:hypothetical protein TRVL_06526 [Trypanosoma vivax]|nr:hypothetical protein TRVL_06526 [Trypanosoma vivax]
MYSCACVYYSKHKIGFPVEVFCLYQYLQKFCIDTCILTRVLLLQEAERSLVSQSQLMALRTSPSPASALPCHTVLNIFISRSLLYPFFFFLFCFAIFLVAAHKSGVDHSRNCAVTFITAVAQNVPWNDSF